MESLILGLSLGFAAGVSPGPLFTLVATSAFERGFGAGLRVALAPILTDAPIIALALIAVDSLPPLFLQLVTAAGGLFVVYLGADTLRSAWRGVAAAELAQPGAADVRRGVLVNLFSPHPWLFWVTVGAPLVLESWRRGPAHAVAFLGAFFALITGSKICIAWLAARGRRRLTGDGYRGVLAAAGILLLALGALLLSHALRTAQ